MIKRKLSFLGSVKKIVLIIISAIFLILFCFTYLHFQTRYRESEDKLIINVFGKQRMYTQMISKNVNQLYALLQAADTESAGRPEEAEDQPTADIRKGLSEARTQFSNTLAAIHRNEVIVDSHHIDINETVIASSDYLKEIDALWVEFNSAIDVIMDAKQADSAVTAAVAYINANNMDLFNQCDGLLEQLLKASIREDKVTQYLAFGLIGLLFVITILFLFQLQRYIIRPYSQLYKGITEIGLEHYPVLPAAPTRKKIMPIVSEISDMFHKINYLITLIESINNSASFMETLRFINSTFSSFIPYNYIGIALISEDKKYLKASYGVSDGSIIGMPEGVMGTTWPIRETSLKDLISLGETRIINDLEEYCADKPVKPYNQSVLESGIRSSISLPLKVSGEPMGVIFFSSRNKDVYNEEHVNFLRTLANSIAISLNQNLFISDIIYSSILALAKLAEARDEDTGEHLDRMSRYSRLIAQLLYENNVYSDEITLEYIDNIERFSPLHDIGKVGIRDGILLKPGRLTPEEFEEMKKHVTFGAQVLTTAEMNMQKKGKSLFTMGIEIAEGHHEKWDGSGYPYGRKDYEIPLSARIVAVADVFDALTSKRPYKEAFPLEMSMNIILEGRGSHFDPAIVDIFMENRERTEELYYQFRSASEFKFAPAGADLKM